MRLVGCIRVSQMRGRTGETFISTDVQRAQVEQYAAAMGHEIVGWQEDLDQPGSTLNRPGLQAALRMIAAGDADGLIAAKLDRITRSIADLGRLLERAQAEAWNLVAVDVGLDLRTPSGRLVAHVLGAVAEWELERRRADWQEARSRAVGRGVHVASRTPVGYQRKDDGRLEPEKAAAAAVVALFERRAAGDGWKTLADAMTATGVLTPYGNPMWTSSSVTKVIRNRVYLGEARSGQYVREGAHEPLVPLGLWEQAQTAGIRPVARIGEAPLLAGLIRCSGCRYIAKPDSMRDGRGIQLRMYRCRAIHAAGRCTEPVSILSRVIEPYVEEQFLIWLRANGPKADAAVATAALSAAEMELAAAEAEMVSFVETETLAIAGRDAYERGLTVRRARVDAAGLAAMNARKKITMIGALTAGDLAAAWPTLSRAEKSEMLRAALDCVVVFPHRSGRPVSDRVVLVFRGDAPDGLPRRGRRLLLEPWPLERPRDVRMPAPKDG